MLLLHFALGTSCGALPTSETVKVWNYMYGMIYQVVV